MLAAQWGMSAIAVIVIAGMARTTGTRCTLGATGGVIRAVVVGVVVRAVGVVVRAVGVVVSFTVLVLNLNAVVRVIVIEIIVVVVRESGRDRGGINRGGGIDRSSRVNRGGGIDRSSRIDRGGGIDGGGGVCRGDDSGGDDSGDTRDNRIDSARRNSHGATSGDENSDDGQCGDQLWFHDFTVQTSW
jgi:hypothetical protein